jgi:hypothetical protein
MPADLRTAPYLADIEMPENLAIGLMISDHRRRCREQAGDFDSDRAAAMERYRASPPATADQESAFVEAVAPRMVDGVARLRGWIDTL